MELQTQDIANVLLIRVEGRVDHTTAQHFQDLLLPQLHSCTGEDKKALVDLSGVHYMSSAGKSFWQRCHRCCKKCSGLAALISCSQCLPRYARR
jgi:anti-anti-sigma factor